MPAAAGHPSAAGECGGVALGMVPTSKTPARHRRPVRRCTGRPRGAQPVRRPRSTGEGSGTGDRPTSSHCHTGAGRSPRTPGTAHHRQPDRCSPAHRNQAARRADGDTPASRHLSGTGPSGRISTVCGGTWIRALLTLSWAARPAVRCRWPPNWTGRRVVLDALERIPFVPAEHVDALLGRPVASAAAPASIPSHPRCRAR
jgi:hypothetical protein